MSDGSQPEKAQAIPQPPGATGRQAVAPIPGATGAYPVLQQPQDQLPAPLLQQQPLARLGTPLTDWAPVLDALTLPQRRYLAAIQAGAAPEAALIRAAASPDRVHRWLTSSPEFVRAHDAIQAGLAVLGVPQARALAAADMPDLVGHWSRKAREAAKDRDQATFGRLLGDVSGATGQGAQVVVSVQSSWRLPPTPLTHQPGGIIEGEWREPDPAPVPLDTGQEPERREAADAERAGDEHRS